MRRCVFYFAVVILAFGIGSIIGGLNWNSQNILQIDDITKTSQLHTQNTLSEKKTTKQPEFVKFRLKDLPCEDKTLQIVWRELKDETAEIRIERAEEIKNCEDFIEVADYLQNDEELDLNNDGVKEIFIRSTESPFSRCGNNCNTYWIFQQTKGKNYRKIFEADGYLPIIKTKKTKGYRDIMFEVYARDIESGNILYKFNGTEYIPKRCWSESLLYKGKGVELVLGKKYHTKYYKCEESGYITNYRNQKIEME